MSAGAFLLDLSSVLGGLGILTALGAWLVNRRKPEVDRGMLQVAEKTVDLTAADSTTEQQGKFLDRVLKRLIDVEDQVKELGALRLIDQALIRDLLADIDDLEAHIWAGKPPPPPPRRRSRPDAVS